VTARDKKTYKKVKKPGYKVEIFQNVALPGQEWETYQCYEESFSKNKLDQAYDAFQREVLNIQTWIEVAESRAKLMPEGKAVFECMNCGWVTNQERDDIVCPGCGRRYWSEKLWKRNN